MPQEYQVIVDFRNLLIHRYFGIDPEEIWNVIQNNLGEFTQTILERISHLDAALKDEIIQDLIEENQHLGFVTAFLQSLQG